VTGHLVATGGDRHVERPDPTALAHDAGGDLVGCHRREPVHVDREAGEAQVGVDGRVLLDRPSGEPGEQAAVQHVG
jgi:hypothetical protein